MTSNTRRFSKEDLPSGDVLAVTGSTSGRKKRGFALKSRRNVFGRPSSSAVTAAANFKKVLDVVKEILQHLDSEAKPYYVLKVRRTCPCASAHALRAPRLCKRVPCARRTRWCCCFA